jgi:hypothetical protein
LQQKFAGVRFCFADPFVVVVAKIVVAHQLRLLPLLRLIPDKLISNFIIYNQPAPTTCPLIWIRGGAMLPPRARPAGPPTLLLSMPSELVGCLGDEVNEMDWRNCTTVLLLVVARLILPGLWARATIACSCKVKNI